MNLKELNEYIKNNTSLIEKHITEIKSIKKDVCKRITELKIPDESQLKHITIDELKVGDYVWFNSNDVKMSLIQIDKIDNNEIWSEHYVYNIENLFVEKDETVEKLNKSEIERCNRIIQDILQDDLIPTAHKLKIIRNQLLKIDRINGK